MTGATRPRDARAEAIRILAEVERGGFADALVGRALQGSTLEPRDRGLLTQLVYATLAWQGRIDWSLELLAPRGIQGLPPGARAALRMGFLQLRILDRIPPHAALHTSVALARQAAGDRAAGFVNAVLRRVSREGERPPPDAAVDAAGHLAVRWSHPRWLVETWQRELGTERAAALLEADQAPAPTVLRARAGAAARPALVEELRRRGAAVRECRFAPAGLVVEETGIHGLDLVARGLPLATQGEASQLVALLATPSPGAPVLDACAVPGGKTRAIADTAVERADAAGQPTLVVGADRSRAGVRTARRDPGALGPEPIAWLVADAGRPPLRDASFAVVLVDAPCSGLGTLRQHPELRWHRRPEDSERLAQVQLRFLTASSRLVRPGGRLVYSTCTIAALENEGVVDRLLETAPGWRVADARRWLPAAAAGLVDGRGFLRTSPDQGGLDGFFAAALVRE